MRECGGRKREGGDQQAREDLHDDRRQVNSGRLDTFEALNCICRGGLVVIMVIEPQLRCSVVLDVGRYDVDDYISGVALSVLV